MLIVLLLAALAVAAVVFGAPYTLTAIIAVPLSDRDDDLLDGKRGRTLTEPSLVEIALNAEDVDITMGATVGPTEVLPSGSRVTLQATVGVLPVFPDDVLVQTFGSVGDEIIIGAVNADAAAAREARVVVRVTAIEDVDLVRVLKQSTGAV